MGQNKQIVIDAGLHHRLRIHVATLGGPTIKAYVESLIEHAMATATPPDERPMEPTDGADVVDPGTSTERTDDW